jgi:hypothetical protein
VDGERYGRMGGQRVRVLSSRAQGGSKGFEFARRERVLSSRAQGGSKGFEFARRERVLSSRAQGGSKGFSSLMKQNKKGKNCAVFCFAGKRKILFYILRCDCEAKFL